jgi:hypothetical protein
MAAADTEIHGDKASPSAPPPAMPEPLPMRRIWMMEGSLQCFACSWFGLVPILGLPLALATIVWAGCVQLKHRREWNPAGAYLNWALALGFAGVLISLAVFTIVTLNVIEQSGSPSYGPFDE